MKSGYDQFFKTARKVAGTADRNESKLRLDSKIKVPLEASARLESQRSAQALKGEVERQLRQKVHFKVPKKRKSSWKMALLSAAGVGISIWGIVHRDKIENLLQSVEISLLGAAQAETKPPDSKTAESKSSETKTAETNQSAKQAAKSSDEGADHQRKVGAEGVTPVEVSGDLSHLQKLVLRKKQLDDREIELARVEDEINKQKIEVEKRMKELEEMRTRISSILEERVKIDEQKADSLMQMYSNMKAPQAAKVFETMDEDLAVEILGRMKKKNAAEILNLLKPEKAQIISEKYAGYRRTPAATSGGDKH